MVISKIASYQDRINEIYTEVDKFLEKNGLDLAAGKVEIDKKTGAERIIQSTKGLTKKGINILIPTTEMDQPVPIIDLRNINFEQLVVTDPNAPTSIATTDQIRKIFLKHLDENLKEIESIDSAHSSRGVAHIDKKDLNKIRNLCANPENDMANLYLLLTTVIGINTNLRFNLEAYSNRNSAFLKIGGEIAKINLNKEFLDFQANILADQVKEVSKIAENLSAPRDQIMERLQNITKAVLPKENYENLIDFNCS